MNFRPKSRRAKRLERQARMSISSLGMEMVKIGASDFDLSDPYHTALTVHWPTFAAGLFALYSLITALFAGLYLLEPGCVANAHTPTDYFFFSIETLATVGYGVMSPTNLYGHLISSAEIITGMAFTAIMTGLVFVRFSRARAKIVFSDVAVVSRHNGCPTLMVRIGNGRTTLLTQTTVQINALISEETAEGGRYRRVCDLPLTRGTFPIFPLITTFMHVINEDSPLAGYDLATLAESDMRLIVTVQARDPKLAAFVYDLKSYSASDVLPAMRFADAITVHESGLVVGDLTRISNVEPDPAFHEPNGKHRQEELAQVGS